MTIKAHTGDAVKDKRGSGKGTTIGSPKAANQLNEILVSSFTTASDKAEAASFTKKALALPLNTFGGLEYYLDIGIGTGPGGHSGPAATLTAVLDSGSDIFWVASSACSSAACTSGRKVFNAGISSTYRPGRTNWTIQYGTAAASGSTANDIMTLGKVALNGTVQFGLADYLDDGFEDVQSDCVIGMGAQTTSDIGPTFLSLLYGTGAIARRMFTLDMNRAVTDDAHGEITFGGLPAAHAERDFTILPNSAEAVTGGPHHWVAKLDSLSVNGQVIVGSVDLGTDAWHAIIDSGTAILFMPYAQVIDFHSAIQDSKYDASADAYIIPCDASPKVTFAFRGLVITLAGSDLMRGARDKAQNECWSAVGTYSNPSVSYILSCSDQCNSGKFDMKPEADTRRRRRTARTL